MTSLLTDEERAVLERAREIKSRLRHAPKSPAHKEAISRAVKAWWDSPAGREERELRVKVARAARVIRRDIKRSSVGPTS